MANQAKKMGARVTLLLGPIGEVVISKGIRVLRFHFFAELFYLLKKELTSKRYDAVIHSAAVSDYQPRIAFKHKLRSGIRSLGLEFSPTFRIVDKIKKMSPATFLVAFKLEFGLSKEGLIIEAKKLMKRSRSNLIVANTFHNNQYRAYILDKEKIKAGPFFSKQNLAKRLIRTIGENL